MHDTAHAAEASTTEPFINVNRKTIERIEGLKKRVAETTIALDKAKREHSDAKSAHDSAQTNLSSAVSDMLDEIHGVSKFPLFDNMSDAIAKAEGDPIVQQLVARMLEHDITNVNALIVAGYNAEQREELTKYLDSLDARKSAEAQNGQPLDSEPPAPPAFLDEDYAPVTDDEADELSGRLELEQNLDIHARTLLKLSRLRFIEVIVWLDKCQDIKTEKGEALTVDDLPTAPSYLLNPSELEPVEEPADADAPNELTTELDESKKKARAPRRKTAKFVNKPRVVKAKKAKKGRK